MGTFTKESICKGRDMGGEFRWLEMRSTMASLKITIELEKELIHFGNG